MPGERSTRAATPDDVPAIRGILAAHGDDGQVMFADVIGPYVAHLVRRHRTLVTVEDGRVVAFGSVVDTGRTAQLADLFVLPDRLGQGIGWPLLAELYGNAPRRTTFASSDPRALPLYVRAGMTPLWPCLYLEGTPPAVGAGDLRTRDAGPAELASLELGWTGARRDADHSFWSSEADADGFVVDDGAGPVAFGYARAKQVSPARALQRLLVRPGADPVEPVLTSLARAARGGRVQTCLLGPSPALPILLGRGFRIVDQDQFLASDPLLVDPIRLLPNPGML